MIGPLLNACNRAIVKATDLTKLILPKKDYFGAGTMSVTLTPGQNLTNRDLYNTYKTNEFKNLTISAGAKLTPYATYGGGRNLESHPNPFHPLIIKCSDTLTVNGELTAKGCGGGWYFYDDYNATMPSISPVPIDISFGGYGYSAWHTTYMRLGEYGKYGKFLSFNTENTSHAYPISYNFTAFPFSRKNNYIENVFNRFNNYSLFLIGAGGGGCHKYHTGSGSHYEHSRHTGLSSSGGYRGKWNCPGGGGGGFIALYFNRLIIDGKEYGVDPGCDVSKISANGLGAGPNQWASSGGGCMILAAKTIIIGSHGTINANAGGDSENFKPSFLNNFPALGEGQYGYVWEPNTSTYNAQTSKSKIYYYNTGVGFDCDASVPYSAWERTGGAGIVLGYKLD